MNPAKISDLLPNSLRTVAYLSCCLALAVPVPASPGPPGTGRPFLLLILLALALLALAVVTSSLFLKKKRLEAALFEAARTEQKLRQTADIYQVLVNNIHEVIFTLDMDFRFTYISPSVKRQRGFTVEEAMNLDISGNVTPDSAHRIFDLFSRGVARIEQGQPAKTPLVMLIDNYCRDGSIRRAELTADFLYGADERPVGIIGVSRYLNDQDEIKSKLTLFRQAIEGTSEAIALTTLTGHHFYHNRAFAELFGYKTPEEVEKDGGPVALFQDRLLGEKIFNTLTKGRPWNGETVMFHREGGEIPVFLKANAIRDKYGKVMALMGSMTDISPIKEREAAMNRQESLYRLLADNISEIISIIDLETQSHIYISPSVERIRGFTPEEVMSQTLPEILTPASYEVAAGVIAEELKKDNRPDPEQNRYRTIELEQLRKDGSTIWTEVMATFLRDDSGRPASLLAAARDITERKKAETAIRESEERYRMLAENISEAIYTIDLETLRHTYASPSVIRMYGFTPEEFIARPIEEVMTPASLELTLATVSEELGKDGRTEVDPNRHITLELELYRRDGSTIGVETTVKILRDEAGAPVSALGMARDITERKKAETAIRESEELYRLLADNTTEIIAIVSLKDMALLYVSPSIEKLKGFTVEESLAMTLESMLTASSHQLTMEVIAEELERDDRPGVDPDRHRTIEVEQTRRDGSVFWTEVAATFLRDETGRPVSILTTSRDITERKKAEDSMKRAKEAAEAASRAKSEFLANMSHEIRTPMNGVIGMTDLLLETGLSEEQLEYAESVNNSAEALLVIINDLLDFSKIEAGKLSLEIIDFDLAKILKEIQRSVTTRLREKPIAHSFNIKGDVPGHLRGDPVRLRQILINLCDNAVKFTETGSVTVRVSSLEQYGSSVKLLFEVKDTGVGIPREHQQSIFDSFSQVDASTTRKYGGTGLGLAITKRLVAMLQGEVGVTSQPDRGSTFWFTAIFENQGETSVKPAATDQSPAITSGPPSLHILLAEDNAISRQVIVQMLEKIGHTVTIAVNGAEAVRMFPDDNFDLVLMDIQMPVMDGTAATSQIQARQRDSQRKVPIVAITANAMAGDREELLNQGLDDYISKPVSMKTLTETIQRNITPFD